MFKIRPLETLPPDFDDCVEEIAEGLSSLYGPMAAMDYRRRARAVFSSNIVHEAVLALGAFDGNRVAGILFGLLREPVAEISFIHVRAGYAGQGVEAQLVREAVALMRTCPIENVVAEVTPFSPLELDSVFAALGFERIARQLMHAPLEAPGLQVRREWRSVPLEQEDWPEAAACIVDAYQDHPGQRLHFEVRSQANALDFLRRVYGGSYGTIEPGYARMIVADGVCAGVILGCEIAPGAGFVLQLAVVRKYQGAGLGAALLRELAHVFRTQSLDKVVLGVTTDNPARRLYERLGFSLLRPIEAFVWQRAEASAAP